MGNERKDEIEARLRVLHSELDASSSAYGDWTLSRAFENLIIALKDATVLNFVSKYIEWQLTTARELKEIIEHRITIREEIQSLEEELAVMEKADENE